LNSVDPANPAADAWASLVAGFYYSGLGDWDKALALSEKVVSLSREIGDGRRLEDGLSILMMHAYLRGDLSRGLGYAEELEERAVSRHADRPLAYGLQGRAYCLLGMGRAEEASEVIDRLEEVHARDPRPADQSLISDTYGLMALAELHRGNLHKALATAEVLLRRVARESPTNFSTIAAYSAPAEVYITAWRRSTDDRTMLRMAARSLRVLKKYSRVFPIGRPRWLLWQGVLDARRGRHRRAVDNLNASLAEANTLGMRIDQIHALGELAALLGDKDPVAADYRRRAADIADGLDIRSESRNVA
jgi:tetratricopeptide (TPR) repeat protein